jgi:tetratricopeptide (TPR) repeat protein
MAEGLLEGVLGGEEQKVDATVPGAEPIVAAVAANVASQSPGVAADTSAMFRKQTEVLELQKKNLEAEYEFFESEAGPRLLALRLRTSFQLFFALFATVIGVGVAVLIYDAFSSHRVVMEPFDTPPALAAQGFTGKVVASGVLDELSHLQEATRSSFTARSLSGAWSNDIRLDVPEAGISVSDMSRLLRERFGHDVRIDGGLVQTPTGGLALTVRGIGVPAKTFAGPPTELDKLTRNAAEYVYSKSQPARWSYYLVEAGRNAEAIEFCRAAYVGADPAERPGLLSNWGNAIENSGKSNREAIILYRAAIKARPDFWIAYTNLMNALMVDGDEESAWRAGEDMRAVAGGRPGRAPEVQYLNWDYLTWNLRAWLDATVADSENGGGSLLSPPGPAIAEVNARMHDADAAELAIKTTSEDANDPGVAAIIHFVRGWLATEAGDATDAATEMEAFGKAYADPIVSTNNPGYHCWIAPAEEAAGHPDKADALLKSAGTYVDCYRFHADILDGRGNWPGAQKAYADAVKLAPDLPAAYYSWGDPLKAWGDVLMKQSQPKEALAKYDEALKYAPNWKQLKEAREAAARLKT